ncbi:transposase family protein [Rhodococcus koreensis]
MTLASDTERGRCPRCDGESARAHSRYRRQLADTAIGGHPVMIECANLKWFWPTFRRGGVSFR